MFKAGLGFQNYVQSFEYLLESCLIHHPKMERVWYNCNSTRILYAICHANVSISRYSSAMPWIPLILNDLRNSSFYAVRRKMQVGYTASAGRCQQFGGDCTGLKIEVSQHSAKPIETGYLSIYSRTSRNHPVNVRKELLASSKASSDSLSQSFIIVIFHFCSASSPGLCLL